MTNRSDDEPAAAASSPACSMHEADDAYMGYVVKDELIAFLSELLEAERAVAEAWVTLESARVADGGPIAELMRFIQRDEERWCAMCSHPPAPSTTWPPTRRDHRTWPSTCRRSPS
jgi:hypothetical protein